MKSIINFFQKILAAFSFVGRKIFGVVSWYKSLWVRLTYNQYDEFVYKRGFAMIMATLVTIVIMPAVISFILQIGYYFATSKKETIYLIQSEQIYPDENIWGVKGCYTAHCEEGTSVYFRIKPALFHHLWSLQDNGHLFLPDALGSSVPTGLTKCEVVSYGIRTRIMMMFNIYPSILKVSCEKGLSN